MKERGERKTRALGPCLFIAPKGCLLAGTVFLIIGSLALGIIATRLGHFLTVDDTLSQADAIVVLGGGNSSAQLSLEAAQELGLPANVSIIDPEAQSTYDEAVNLRQLTQEYGWHSLIVVTEPLHTRRAARTFRALLPNTDIYLTAGPDPRYNLDHWWQSEDGLVGVFNEMLKLGFYWAKYSIWPF